MANWIQGYFKIKSDSKKNIQDFLFRFEIVNQDEICRELGIEPYSQSFARVRLYSFYTKKDLEDVMGSVKEVEEMGKTFYVLEEQCEIAYSATTSLLLDCQSSYLKKRNGERNEHYISIDEACLAHNVTIELFTISEDDGFEERLVVDSAGKIIINSSRSIKLVEEDDHHYTIGGFSNDGDYPWLF